MIAAVTHMPRIFICIRNVLRKCQQHFRPESIC